MTFEAPSTHGSTISELATERLMAKQPLSRPSGRIVRLGRAGRVRRGR
jgi:hypothetical protein